MRGEFTQTSERPPRFMIWPRAINWPRWVNCLLLLTVTAGILERRTPEVQAEEPAAAPVDFARDVMPIFQAHCLRCHGPEQQESNYRLDLKAVAIGAGDSGKPAIAPGDPSSSRLLHVIDGDDADGLVMPPEDAAHSEKSDATSDQPTARPLTEDGRLHADDRAVLRRWIEQGAVWPDEWAGGSPELKTDHWSFQPVRRLPPPRTGDPWVLSPIDAFIFDRLHQEGLTPSPESDRRRLIRRVYLDLLGLPPTPNEVRAFEQDSTPNAYERLVDRVLTSPRYGERWARHWLDVIRFGESDGFETNPERPRAYPYRDYVIQSLNQDRPYDQFVMEQIAGDALGADVATGFLVAGPFDRVKSPDIALTLMQRQDELADIINTTGTAFLGLTVGCARCHNHKFDPITQQDYYSMQAVFAGVQHGERSLRTGDAEKIQYQIQQLAAEQAELERQRNAWMAQSQARPAHGQLREPVNARYNTERFPPVAARWIRFSIAATAGGGEPCIDELEVFAVTNSNDSPHNVALARDGAKASASGTLPGYEFHKLEHLNDGEYGNHRSWISNQANTGWVQIELPEAVTIDRIDWARDRQGQFGDRIPAQYKIEVASEPNAWQTVASSDDRQPVANASSDPFAFIDGLPADLVPKARELKQKMTDLRERMNRLQSTVPVAYVGTFSTPAPTHRLYRGDPMSPREPVAPDAIRVISSLGLSADTQEQERRLALARWFADRNNPLTARVLVNRVWHYHFGTGIVATPSDFGANGVPPTHPELLDWLATQFVENGWSIKWLHRAIVLSNTYRQSSEPRADGLAADAGGRLLWRFPPRRLEAEAIRDSLLLVTSSLNLEAGGKGFNVFEVQQETVHHYFPKTNWGPSEWRRMIYMTKIRAEQDAVFGLFDCPDGGQVMPNRSRSTTPLQALNLLNSQFVLQQAERFAERLQREAGGESASQVTQAFWHTCGREPDAQELEWSVALIHEHGLSAFCRALLNANEFLFLN